ncbi:MAG: tetratricopeptide repeat protein, partial [Bacteroidales bacterium]|nr:tetratricopeptide repeat protein [Bacteroidales bacterium]
MNKALFILSIILLFSCSRHNDAEMFLEKAQSVMETSPDTAAMYLDSILMPEKFLKKEKYMEYLVTKVQAKYKNYDNIKEDTNIFETKAYFNKKVQKPIANSQSSKYQMYAHLYSACVYDERGEYENAMKDYKTAFTLAENMHDSLYMWRINNYIAEVFVQQTYWNEALEIYLESINLSNGNVEKARSYANLAKMYYLKDDNDQVIYYIERSIDMAKKIDDENTKSQIYQNAYVYYKENNERELAWKYLKMSVNYNCDYVSDCFYNLNFLCFFLDDVNMDSAKIYVNKLRKEFETVEVNHTKISMCDALSIYYMHNNMYDSALYYQKELTYAYNDIYEQSMEQNIYEIQQKYDHELQRNIYQTKLNKRLILTVCILIVLLLVLVISFLIITKSKRREQVLTKEVEDLSNVKNDYDKFKHEIKESFDNSLKARFDIIRKVNIFERNNKTNKNVKEIKEYAYGS